MNEGEKTGEVRLLDLGEVGAVTVVKWLVEEGDPVEAGAGLLEVETEKTTFVVDAPRAGRLVRILKREGERVRRDDLLAHIV